VVLRDRVVRSDASEDEMSAFRVTAPATRKRIELRHESPDYPREVLMTLDVGGQELTVPVNDDRSVPTLLLRMPTSYRVTIEGVS
jgi:hypothetical protein